MRTKTLYITIAILLMVSFTAGAQSALRGSYFLENSVQRTKLNPAFAARSNYFGIPVLTSIGAGVSSNMGMSDFIFPIDGNTYTYLNKNVPMEDFIKTLPMNPFLNLDFDTDIFRIGFYTSPESFWTIDLGVNVGVEASLPRDLFILAKMGMPDGAATDYYLNDFKMYETIAAELSLGYSRDMSSVLEGLRIGGRLNFIAPASHISMEMSEAHIYMSEEKWMVNSSASVNIAGEATRLETDGEDYSFQLYPEKIGLAGFGLSVDLGAEYRLSIGSIFDGLSLSLAVTDVGFINYNASKIQSMAAKGSGEFKGIEGISVSEELDIEDSMDDVLDDFMGIADFKDVTPTNISRRSKANILVGAEMPFLKDKMSVGLLYSSRLGYSNTWNELTVSYNLTPIKCFNFGLNYSFLNNARNFGWILEFNSFAGINFFAGMDYLFTRVSPQFIPIDNFLMNMRLGFTFALETKHQKRK